MTGAESSAIAVASIGVNETSPSRAHSQFDPVFQRHAHPGPWPSASSLSWQWPLQSMQADGLALAYRRAGPVGGACPQTARSLAGPLLVGWLTARCSLQTSRFSCQPPESLLR
jgi:hypothetical protein